MPMRVNNYQVYARNSLKTSYLHDAVRFCGEEQVGQKKRCFVWFRAGESQTTFR